MSQAMAVMPESAFYFHLAGVAVLALLLVIARAVYLIMAVKTGRVERAQQLAWVATWRILALLGIWTAIVYASGAWERAGAHNCRRVPASGAAAHYAAEYCYLREDKVLLRLYSRGRGALLAERTYASTGPVRLSWDGDMLVYDPGATDGKGHLKLPPTLRDRMLARLP